MFGATPVMLTISNRVSPCQLCFWIKNSAARANSLRFLGVTTRVVRRENLIFAILPPQYKAHRLFAQ